MVKVALLLAVVLLLPIVGESATSPECLPNPLPTTPTPPTFGGNFTWGSSDRMNMALWRQPCLDGTTAPVLLRITPLSTGPFWCDGNLTVLQGGRQFNSIDTKTVLSSSDFGYCDDLFIAQTFVMVVRPTGGVEFNESQAFRLLIDAASAGTFSLDVPAAPAPPLPVTLAGAAILPGSRAVQVGQTATVFATLLATGPGTATGCTIAPANAPPGTAFAYQQTNAANQPIGTPNTPATIPGGQGQSFVLSLTPSQAFPATQINFAYGCTNTNAVSVIPGVNTLLLTSSTSPTPDIVALAAAVGGIVSLPGPTGIGALAVATVNVGASALITVTADTGGAQLPLTLTLCQTNPLTGVCINPTTPASSVNVQINANETPTFAIFAQGAGTIPFSPGVNRINVLYKTQTGGTVGSTSVAVRTQ